MISISQDEVHLYQGQTNEFENRQNLSVIVHVQVSQKFKISLFQSLSYPIGHGSSRGHQDDSCVPSETQLHLVITVYTHFMDYMESLLKGHILSEQFVKLIINC